MKKITVPLILSAALMLPCAALADNPIVQTRFTADPAPMLSEDGETLYLFTSHDEPEGGENGVMYVMNDWNLYSTKDMVNWTDLGVPTSYEVFDWAVGDAWAIQTVRGFDGRYYLYAPVNSERGNSIGVAVADRPEGPYTDAIGKPIAAQFTFIDPTVYVDYESGRAFMMWGNPDPYFAELNRDMISFKTQPVKINKTIESFGDSTSEDRETRYEEGPWIYIRGGFCYLVYAGNGIPEDLEYSICTKEEFLSWVETLPAADGTSTYQSKDGPWKYGNVLMATFDSGTFTNHPGVVDFKNNSYLFYHTAKLPGSGGFRRSVAVDSMYYNEDGSIQEAVPTTEGPAAIGALDPYSLTEAETIAYSLGVETDEYYTNTATGEVTDTFTNADTKHVYVTGIENGDYIKVKNVDFGAANAKLSLDTADNGISYTADTSGLTDEDIYIAGYSQDGTLLQLCRHSAADGECSGMLSADGIKTVGAFAWEKGTQTPVWSEKRAADALAEAGIFTVRAAAGGKGGEIELHLDSIDGELIGTMPVSYTGGNDIWQTKYTAVSGASGIHDLYFVFRGEERAEDLFMLDNWRFEPKTAEKTLTALNAYIDEYKIDIREGANTANIKVMAIYSDGSSEDVTALAEVSSDNISYSNGVITGTSYGRAVINVSYGGVSEDVMLWVKDMETEEKAAYLYSDPAEVSLVYGGLPAEVTVTAVFEDEHEEDVTLKAEYVSNDESVATVENGVITPVGAGQTVISISYAGKFGEPAVMELPVRVNTNMIVNGDFESGSVEPWTPFYSTLLVEDDGTGNKVLRITDRDTDESGAQGTANSAHYVMGTDLQPGKTYKFSAKLKYNDGPDTRAFTMSFWNNWQKYIEDASWGDIYGNYTLSELTATKGEWTTFSGTVTIPADAYIDPKLALTFTSTWVAEPTLENDLMDLYIDDVSFAVVGDAPAAGDNLITNGDFESGSVEPWMPFYSTLLVEDDGTGNKVLRITDRDTDESGAQGTANSAHYVMGTDLQPGKTYKFSAKLKYNDGPDTRAFTMSFWNNWQKYIEDASWGDIYGNYTLSELTATKGEWTTFSGTVTIPADAYIDPKLALTFTSTWVAEPTLENDLMDLYIDDVSFAVVGDAPAAGDNLITNGDFESGSAEPWTPYFASIAVEDDGTGNNILKVFDRDSTESGEQGTANGTMYLLANTLEPGRTYTFSAKLRYDDGPDTKEFNMSFWNGWNKYLEDASWGDIYGNYTLATLTATKGEWTEFRGSVTIPEEAYLDSQLSLTFSTKWTAEPTAEEDLMDYYLDDVTLKLSE